MTGRCVCCLLWFKIRRDGNIRVHGTMRGNLCAGSDRPPVIEQ